MTPTSTPMESPPVARHNLTQGIVFSRSRWVSYVQQLCLFPGALCFSPYYQILKGRRLANDFWLGYTDGSMCWKGPIFSGQLQSYHKVRNITCVPGNISVSYTISLVSLLVVIERGTWLQKHSSFVCCKPWTCICIDNCSTRLIRRIKKHNLLNID